MLFPSVRFLPACLAPGASKRRTAPRPARAHVLGRRGGCVRRLTGRGLLARTFCQLWSSKCLPSVFCPSEETGKMILSLGTCLGLMVH